MRNLPYDSSRFTTSKDKPISRFAMIDNLLSPRLDTRIVNEERDYFLTC